jgi:7-cyano-7-deazaguanine synthase
MGMERAVVLLSGGLDSATCAALACKAYEVHALTVDYGSRHSRELDSARRIAEHFGIDNHTIIGLELDKIGGSALLDESMLVTDAPSPEGIGKGIPTTYVPARNMIFLSLAVALAESMDAKNVFIGANAIDFSGYPDCRPEFLEAFQTVVSAGTRTGVEGTGIVIEAPLLHMTKADIVRLGSELGVPFELTWTCYRGGERACGRCEACVLRLKGFREAGVVDPIEYED